MRKNISSILKHRSRSHGLNTSNKENIKGQTSMNSSLKKSIQNQRPGTQQDYCRTINSDRDNRNGEGKPGKNVGLASNTP